MLDACSIHNGLNQGSVLLPLLFSFALEGPRNQRGNETEWVTSGSGQESWFRSKPGENKYTFMSRHQTAGQSCEGC